MKFKSLTIPLWCTHWSPCLRASTVFISCKMVFHNIHNYPFHSRIIKLIFKALHRLCHLFLVRMWGMRHFLLENPETPIAILQIRQKSLLLQKHNQPAQYDNIKMVGSKKRVFKLDVDDQDNRFLGLVSKECHDAENQIQKSVCGWYPVLLSLLSPKVSYTSALTANKPSPRHSWITSPKSKVRYISETGERNLIVFQRGMEQRYSIILKHQCVVHKKRYVHSLYIAQIPCF